MTLVLVRPLDGTSQRGTSGALLLSEEYFEQAGRATWVGRVFWNDPGHALRVDRAVAPAFDHAGLVILAGLSRPELVGRQAVELRQDMSLDQFVDLRGQHRAEVEGAPGHEVGSDDQVDLGTRLPIIDHLVKRVSLWFQHILDDPGSE
jgi:hypothetical protein